MAGAWQYVLPDHRGSVRHLVDAKRLTGDVDAPCGSSRSRRTSQCSFSADTPVVTDDGLHRIPGLEIGDQVLAYNEELGSTDFYTVTAVWGHLDHAVVTLTIDGERIETTPNHPFFISTARWVAAGDLWLGARVRQADGTYGTVEAIAVQRRPQVMYNLTVARAHTYFVGDGQWLVHNQCPDGGGGGKKPTTHRRYEASDKHGSKPRQSKKGIVNPEPRNAQAILDSSIQLKGTSARRIGIDYETSIFVIFDETHPGKGIFHGHTRSWQELNVDMQRALIKAKLVSKRGKIRSP